MKRSQIVHDVYAAMEQQVFDASVEWDFPLDGGGMLNTMSGHLQGIEQLPFVISVLMDGRERGVYSVAVFTDIGVIKTTHDPPFTDPGEDRVKKAIDQAIQYARGVIVSCQGRVIEKASGIAA